MFFNDLLAKAAIDPNEVLVMRHSPFEPRLKVVLPTLAAYRPEVFNTYQQTQSLREEGMLLRARYLASFIGYKPGKAIFVGVYKIGGTKPLTRNEFWEVPGNREMKAFGMEGALRDGRESCLWFDLQLTDLYAAWKGRLVLGWTGLERSWVRWAAQNEFPVTAILEENGFEKAMPHWYEIDLSWADLSLLQPSWEAALAQWRGIYFVYDTNAKLGYVGSASGSENLLGRWRHYSKTGHGDNRLLRSRNPQDFRFTILELLSPTAPAGEIGDKESNWKDRLHTRSPLGLNLN